MSTAAEAILSAISAVVPVDVAVYEALVPGVPSARYVVLYAPGGHRTSSTIDGISNDIGLQFQTTCVASDANPSYSAAYCRWLSTAVRDGLVDLIVTADGWAPARIRHEGAQSPQPDEATPDKKVYATDQYSLQTVRLS